MKTLIAAALAVAGFAALPSLALGQDLTFQLTNESSQAITHFYTSPATTEVWEEDVFGDGILYAGYSVPITIADGSDQCVYDMKFVPESGEEFIVIEIDLCTLAGGEYTLVDAE